MKKIGMLTPSSNTVVEPVTAAMASSLSEVSVHFTRFKLTRILIGENKRGESDTESLLEAASLLADAGVDVIAYNATSGGWLGEQSDQALCTAITELTSIPATTSILSLLQALRLYKIGTYCLVTPLVDEVTAQVIEQYRKQGFECTGHRNFNVKMNKLSSSITDEQILTAVKESFVPGTDAIVLSGTNMRAAHLAASLEDEYGVPVFDTAAATLWQTLRLSGLDNAGIQGWGRLLAGK
ncbi:aspartate/glutamate racemase family protein [Paenibacillus beijingensis]|uniref:Asp/Glu/hydantoin racemase n=1 Tax=Paenibacillus beijingensis TaxID=1126833 RepID=A0A0D5NI44_9BACL|nr:aspartate/glutamate racemase family protein [Paenibacillus beijingensis]AJY74780.1 hypothetical protein VN24_09505 [Paenibacillus beijingensis]